MPVTAIIPTLNEEERIASTIDAAFAAGVAEVIVSDGGSTDGTIEIAAAHGARVLTGETMRSRQLNRGAEAASHEELIFLHADTTLPPGAAAAVSAALANGIVFGGFRIAFAEPAPKLRLAAMMINLRTRLTRCPWGDQAQFIRRDTFLSGGRFQEIPLMEDYDLAVRMRRRGRTAVLPLRVVTSGRRFLALGVLRTAARNWRIVVAYRRGVDPWNLAALYRRK